MWRLPLWTSGITLAAMAGLTAPAVRESLRNPAETRAWRRDLYVVQPRLVARLLREGRRVVFVDAREAEEFAQAHLPTALSVPLRRVADMDLSACRDADLVIPYCLKDLRGFEAAKILRARGLANVGLFEGFGLYSWEAAGLPLAGTWSGWSDAQALQELAETGGP